MSFDILICLGPKDLPTIQYCLKGIIDHVKNFRKIFLISSKEYNFGDKVTIINENKFPFTLQDIDSYLNFPIRCGWYFQQLLKLYAPSIITEILDDYVVIDADTIFIKDITFKDGDKYLFNTSDEFHPPYFEWMRRLHSDLTKVEKRSGICHHMIFNRNIIKELINFIHENKSKNFWETFMDAVDPSLYKYSGASEYELYFNWMCKNHKDKIIIRSLPFTNQGGDPRYINKNTDSYYISIHWWMRQCMETRDIEKNITDNINSWYSSFNTISNIDESDVINGERLQELCDLTIITKDIKSFHTSLPKNIKLMYLDNIDKNTLNNAKSIFVYTHILDSFIQSVWPIISNNVIIMTHNSDHTINESHLQFLNEPKLISLFCQNASINHDKIVCLPIGIANSMWPHGNTKLISDLSKQNSSSKEFKIMVNFRPDTYKPHRSDVLKIIFDNLKSHSRLVQTNSPTVLSLKNSQSSIFTACPRGNGPDTHRLWEALYMGSIPIVDDIVNSRYFDDLPLIYVKDWNKIDLKFLKKEFNKIKSKRFNYNKLKLSFWKSKLNSLLTKEDELSLQSLSLNTVTANFVIAYLGKLPSYIIDCVKQIRLWNSSQPIYVACDDNNTNKEIIEKLKQYNVIIADTQTIQKTPNHNLFIRSYTNTSMNNFWKYTMERFFTVEDIMNHYNIQNVFHLEADNLIYFNIDHLITRFNMINKILIPSDNETRYIAGVCYIPNIQKLNSLNQWLSFNHRNSAEMESIMTFSKYIPNIIETLPVIMNEYTLPFRPDQGMPVSDPERLYRYASYLDGIFDAAAIGQYFFGIDPIHDKNNTDGYVNPHCAFKSDLLTYMWYLDDSNKWCLKASYNNSQWYKVYNIHVHNKALHRGLSDSENIISKLI